MSIRTILADDHKVLRHGLSEALGKENGIEVIAEAENGLKAIELARRLSADLIIMDVSMPDLNGVEATRQIAKDCPKTKIIALSMHSGRNLVKEMFKAGAAGYLLKDCEYPELIQAIQIVMSGKTYISPSVSESLIEDYMKTSDSTKKNVFTVLSDREREVLQLLTEGRTTKETALKLHISPKTVEGHRSRIMKKLDIDNIANLTKYAIQEGLTQADPNHN